MRFLILIASLSAALFAAACHDDEVCNPGLQLRDGVCVPIASEDAGTSDGGTSDADSGDGSPADDSATD